MERGELARSYLEERDHPCGNCFYSACRCADCVSPGCHPALRQVGEASADDARVVRELEEQVAAATERNDADGLAPYLASDFTFVNPAGVLVTKDQFSNGSTSEHRI